MSIGPAPGGSRGGGTPTRTRPAPVSMMPEPSWGGGGSPPDGAHAHLHPFWPWHSAILPVRKIIEKPWENKVRRPSPDGARPSGPSGKVWHSLILYPWGPFLAPTLARRSMMPAPHSLIPRSSILKPLLAPWSWGGGMPPRTLPAPPSMMPDPHSLSPGRCPCPPAPPPTLALRDLADSKNH